MQTQHKQPGYIHKRALRSPTHTTAKHVQTSKRTTTNTDHTTLPATRRSLRPHTKQIQKDDTLNLTSAHLNGLANKPAATSCLKAGRISFRRPRSIAKYSCSANKTKKRRNFLGSAPPYSGRKTCTSFCRRHVLRPFTRSVDGHDEWNFATWTALRVSRVRKLPGTAGSSLQDRGRQRDSDGQENQMRASGLKCARFTVNSRLKHRYGRQMWSVSLDNI
jgi:hypothetical protein